MESEPAVSFEQRSNPTKYLSVNHHIFIIPFPLKQINKLYHKVIKT